MLRWGIMMACCHSESVGSAGNIFSTFKLILSLSHGLQDCGPLNRAKFSLWCLIICNLVKRKVMFEFPNMKGQVGWGVRFCVEKKKLLLRHVYFYLYIFRHDIETPTRLRKEVEDLTANMQALVNLTPGTLQTRAKSRRYWCLHLLTQLHLVWPNDKIGS